MANTVISIKKSGSPGATPASLQHGELGLNYNDGKLYYLDATNTIASIYTANSYSVISANSSLLLASNPNDILTINPSGAIVINTDSLNDSIYIGIRQATTSQNGVVQLYSGIDSQSNELAASALSVNTVSDIVHTAFQQANNAYEQANNAVLTLIGTENQIEANSSTGNIQLSLPSTINVNSNSTSSINITENNSYSGNALISWAFNVSGYNTLQSTANLTFTPSTGVLRSTGFAAKAGLIEHANIIQVDYAISNGYNAISAGPVSIANNITVTIPAGSTWTIV